jgi:TonB family protein
MVDMLNNRPEYPAKFLMLVMACLIFCSFNVKEVQTTAAHNQQAVADTVPAKELRNIDRKNIRAVISGNGAIIVELKDGNNLLVSRQDLENDARERTEPDEYAKTFTKVEIEPDFPGGSPAWLKYLNKSMHYPKEAIEKEIQGTVVVQFIVETDGKVNEVEAVSGPNTGGLREEAVRLIKMSGTWNTAIQNFRVVRAYKKQPITFRIE